MARASERPLEHTPHLAAGAPGDEVEKLRRRVRRERVARQTAEAAAEKALWTLLRRHKEVELMRAVATAANEGQFLGAGLRASLQCISEHVGAAAGHVWKCPAGANVLVATGLWHLSSNGAYDRLVASTEAVSLRRGEWLPGRVLASGRPEWVEDLDTDRNDSRDMVWSDLGVKSAFALPALVGADVAAVFEFFFFEARPCDSALLALANDIGEQIGRAIERHRANWALARSRVELEARVRERTADLEARVRERTADLERANAELRRTIAEQSAADAANRAKTEFLANMSHEIRTPITAVLGYASLLLEPELPAEQRLEHVRTIHRNGSHLLVILDDILDLSKIEAGKLSVEAIACSPYQIVQEVASLMRVRAREKGLHFTAGCATPVPEFMRSDPTRLRQILLNLVGNAIKFTAAGEVSLTVRCDAPGAPRPRVSFDITDQGIGMTAAEIDRLFLPFSQADSSTTRRHGGTGLGLAISGRLAGMLGGEISVRSEPGRGSTFTASFDVGLLAEVALLSDLQGSPPPSSVLPMLPQAGPPLAGSVLLAEDGPDNQRLISTVLRNAGASVTIVENGRLAVTAAFGAADAGRPFDVVLLDMQMPELDGYGAVAELRAAGYRGAVIALTAHAMSTDRDKCLRAGCDDFLSKPLDFARFVPTLRRWMGAAPHAAAVAPAPLTERRLAPLVSSFADDAAMGELVAAFVGVLGDREASLRDALSRGDRKALGQLAHQLRGAGGSYGFDVISEVAGRLEASLRSGGDDAAVAPLVGELALLCARARAGAQAP